MSSRPHRGCVAISGAFAVRRSPSATTTISRSRNSFSLWPGTTGTCGWKPEDDDTLDWGVLVPLSFIKARQIVSLSIVRAYEEHRTLGQLVRRCAEELGRDTLFLASGDLSHALTRSAPASYDPRGALLDAEVVRALRIGDFAALNGLGRSLRQGAAECGLRSFVTLGGFLGKDATVDPQVLSYEGPFGVGYMVALFGRADPGRSGTP